MASSQETHFLRSIMATIPKEMASKIRQLCSEPTNEIFLENLVRFISGAPHSSEASDVLRTEWSEKQVKTRDVLDPLLSSLSSRKRPHTNDDEDADSKPVTVKRQRFTPTLPPDEEGSSNGAGQQSTPLYTLHSISTTSPIRKKVDITIRQNVILFTNPSTKSLEASVPLSSLKRAFIIPTRGKSKAHWTIILLSNDIPENPKSKQASQGTTTTTPNNTASENQQIIFGIDANSSATFTTTTYSSTGDANAQTHPKNTPTLPHIQNFLSHLTNIQTITPTASAFKSACSGVLAGTSASSDGIPGVEAYRAAKAGNLWFSADGILWGESKPCEFWDVKDLIGKDDGVKIIGAGRTCTVILTRRSNPGEADGELDVGDETQFGMVDSREREPITSWIKRHRHLFGTAGTSEESSSSSSPDKQKGKEKKVKKEPRPAGPLTIHMMPDESDDSDEEFNAETSGLDGSEASSDEGSSDPEHDDDNEEEEEEEAGDDEDESDLDPARHPLLRPGAVPRMSKAALDMAVGVVEDTFIGDGEAQMDDDEDMAEEDELED